MTKRQLVVRSTHLPEGVLTKHDDSLAVACRAANRDEVLEREIEDWQSFDDGVAAVFSPFGLRRLDAAFSCARIDAPRHPSLTPNPPMCRR